ANGVLKVKAKDKGTGKEQHITIQGSTGMDDAEVDRLVKEAEAKKEEDKKKKDLVDAKNTADSTVAQAEKMLRDNADKVEDADKKLVEEKIAKVKEALAKTEATKEDLESPTKELNDTMMSVGQKVYSQPGAEQAQSSETKSDDGVVDGDVETDGNTTRV
ncbi:MAG: Hsp70 family protein, partial [Candidatus Gracilibacteria bacterium]|nr:Hsp70 family protein [Candidatus Gracilibacteria bacterium]